MSFENKVCVLRPKKIIWTIVPLCRLKTIPPSFGNLIRLKRVVLDYNCLRRLPETLGKMRCLSLNVSNNRLVRCSVRRGGATYSLYKSLLRGPQGRHMTYHSEGLPELLLQHVLMLD